MEPMVRPLTPISTLGLPLSVSISGASLSVRPDPVDN